MKIGQAIDMMMEDEERQYVGELDGFRYEITCVNGEIETMVENKENREKKVLWGIPLSRISKEVDWKLMQKPVSFMEAVKSEKLFRVEYRNIDSFDDLGYCDLVEFFVYMEEEYEEPTIRDILLEGKFYIKED